MATLHGILAELGIEAPTMHPEREIPSGDDWVSGVPFQPEQDLSYELLLGDAEHHVRKIVRIDGIAPAEWYDLEYERPLDATLRALPVRAYRRLGD